MSSGKIYDGPNKSAHGLKLDDELITKDEAILSLYQAIEKIYKGQGTKSEHVLESALYLLKYVSEKYLLPQIGRHSGQDKKDIMTELHKINDIKGDY